MITSRVGLSHVEKILVTESGARRNYNWAYFLKFRFFNWGGDKLISEYFLEMLPWQYTMSGAVE